MGDIMDDKLQQIFSSIKGNYECNLSPRAFSDELATRSNSEDEDEMRFRQARKCVCAFHHLAEYPAGFDSAVSIHPPYLWLGWN